MERGIQFRRQGSGRVLAARAALKLRMDIFDKIRQKKVIPAIRNIRDIPVALDKGSQVLFLLTGDIFDLLKIKEEFIAPSRAVFLLHLDLVKGVARDQAGIRFLKTNVQTGFFCL